MRSVLVAVPLFVASLAVTLTAARLFAQRLDRLGTRFGFPEALIGLLTALAADGPEISTALVALFKGANGVSVGVLVGSNVFNLAAMIGLSAMLVGGVRLLRDVLVLEGAVTVIATVIATAVLLGWLPAVVAVILIVLVLVPYLVIVARQARSTPGGATDGIVEKPARAPMGHRLRWRRSPDPGDPTYHLLGWAIVDVVVIVAGSIGMVQAALAVGGRWRISNADLGVLVLAPLTSIPNAATAARLGCAHRGAALISETFHSNTINLVAGVTIPSLFVTVTARSMVGWVDVAWLLAMTAVCIAQLARPRGLGRIAGTVLIASYVAFVAVQLTAG